MTETIHASVSASPLNFETAYDFVSDPANGAIDTFIGVVRNHHDDKPVKGITYDIHDTLAEKEFYEICLETQNLWERTKIYLSHYKGRLEVGGVSVIIAVGSPHRAEAFEACRYIIEELKKRAPVWKQEHYEHGDSEWLPGHSLNGQVKIKQEPLQKPPEQGGGCGSGQCGCNAPVKPAERIHKQPIKQPQAIGGGCGSGGCGCG